MNLVHAPKVSLLGYNGFPPYHDDALYPEDIVAYAIRECYDSHGKSTEATDAKLVASIASRDESPIEHAVFTFEIECSRACSHQIVRHRIASYSQRSQRYVKEKDPDFYIPQTIVDGGVAHTNYVNTLGMLAGHYTMLLEQGCKPEDARYILPNATMTQLVATYNARSLRNFLKLRLNKRAQAEIRQVAQQMLKLVIEVAPNLFKDLEVEG